MRTRSSVLLLVAALLAPLQLQAAPSLDFNLLHNLPLAHRHQDGVLVDGASVSSLKYLRDKRRLWHGEKEIGGEPVLLPTKISANFWIPTVGQSKEGQVLDALIYPLGRGQRVDVFVNGRKIAHEDFQGERWYSLRYPIPSELLQEKITRVRFHFRRRVEREGLQVPAAFRALRVGDKQIAELPTPGVALTKRLRYRKGQQVLLPARQGLDFYIPSTGALTFSGEVTRGTLIAKVQRDGKAPVLLGESSGRFSFPLKRFGVRGLRLILRSKEGPVSLKGGIIRGSSGEAPTLRRPKNVLFWLIDTLRADKLR
ncbi:MAG: hypothetical protein VYD19_06140, partial [Myxococcota bacterium]|nr:hypothetical protein [Myxococcota bacterium]